MTLRLAVLAAMLMGCASTAATTANPAQELRYQVELETTATAPDDRCRGRQTGFASRDSLGAYLPYWGDRTELGRPYLKNVSARGRPVAAAAAGTIPLGTGPFVLHYELPVLEDTSAATERWRWAYDLN